MGYRRIVLPERLHSVKCDYQHCDNEILAGEECYSKERRGHTKHYCLDCYEKMWV